MVSEELKIIIDKIREQGKMNIDFGGATVEQIQAFENKNGIVLPSKFKEWLSFCDGGELYLPAGVQFYGIAHKPVIDIDDNDRPNDNYIVIGALSTGDPILFKKGEEQIAIFNHEAGTIEDDEQYVDFFAFLNDLNVLLGIGG